MMSRVSHQRVDRIVLQLTVERRDAGHNRLFWLFTCITVCAMFTYVCSYMNLTPNATSTVFWLHQQVVHTRINTNVNSSLDAALAPAATNARRPPHRGKAKPPKNMPAPQPDAFHTIPPNDTVAGSLVLATTFTTSPYKMALYTRTVMLWAQLQPYVQPVLYYDKGLNNTLINLALTLGWRVFELHQQQQTNVSEPPVLKSIFAHLAQNFASARFHGYANGDIVFTQDLIHTLNYLDGVSRQLFWHHLFLTGRRTNANFSESIRLNTAADVWQLSRKGQLYNCGSEDYFITLANGYPWSSIPPFVVGRVGYDNWLVAHAIMQRLPAIDVTETVTAVHLTDVDGTRAGHQAVTGNDSNMKLIDNNFDFSLGSTNCIPFYTMRSSKKSNNLKLFRRKFDNRRVCAQALRRRHLDRQMFWNAWLALCPLCSSR